MPDKDCRQRAGEVPIEWAVEQGGRTEDPVATYPDGIERRNVGQWLGQCRGFGRLKTKNLL